MDRLVVFLNYPESGGARAKSGPSAAEPALLERMTAEHLLRHIRRAMSRKSFKTELRFTGGTRRVIADWLGKDLLISPQVRGDLGLKLNNAFKQSFEAGASKTMVIGTDFPALTSDLITQAFKALDSTDVVLGGGIGGELYLAGLKRPAPGLFRDIPWGTVRAYLTVLFRARKARLDPCLLPMLQGMRKPEDLRSLGKAFPLMASEEGPRISVVVPALKTDRRIFPALKSALSGANAEVIVACDCEPNRTTHDAARAGASVVFCRKGRAALMNKGAGIATGTILLFLYADTVLPLNYDRTVREILSDPSVSLGAFRLRIDSPAKGLRLIERAANWRSRRLRLPYGDQALFLPAKIFADIGGFPDWPLMEDLAAVQALRRKGKIVIAPARVLVTSERWKKFGIIRTALLNQVALAGYAVGVPTERLARLYYGASAGRRQIDRKTAHQPRQQTNRPSGRELWDS